MLFRRLREESLRHKHFRQTSGQVLFRKCGISAQRPRLHITLGRGIVKEQFADYHTGRELELMLAARKPMAKFYAATCELPNEEFIPEKAFAPYVGDGRMSRYAIEFDDVTPTGLAVVLRYVFFALPGEEWRMYAMELLVRAVHSGGGWNETCQRVEGALLGYTPEEVDEYCRTSFRSPSS